MICRDWHCRFERPLLVGALRRIVAEELRGPQPLAEIARDALLSVGIDPYLAPEAPERDDFERKEPHA